MLERPRLKKRETLKANRLIIGLALVVGAFLSSCTATEECEVTGPQDIPSGTVTIVDCSDLDHSKPEEIVEAYNRLEEQKLNADGLLCPVVYTEAGVNYTICLVIAGGTDTVWGIVDAPEDAQSVLEVMKDRWEDPQAGATRWISEQRDYSTFIAHIQEALEAMRTGTTVMPKYEDYLHAPRAVILFDDPRPRGPIAVEACNSAHKVHILDEGQVVGPSGYAIVYAQDMACNALVQGPKIIPVGNEFWGLYPRTGAFIPIEDVK